MDAFMINLQLAAILMNSVCINDNGSCGDFYCIRSIQPSPFLILFFRHNISIAEEKHA